MRIRYFLIAVLILNANLFLCQTHNKIGIRTGVLISGMSSDNSKDMVFTDTSSAFTYVSFDIGIYKEWFDTKRFCISTEVHYLIKGEQNPAHSLIVTPIKTSQGDVYEYRYIPDRFQYLSFQIFPRFRIIVTPTGENIYLFAGPTFDLLLNNTNSDFPDQKVPLSNSKLTFSGSIGAGSEILDFLSCEIRYDHSFIGPYSITYGNQTVPRRHNAIIFLAGISFNKFFK